MSGLGPMFVTTKHEACGLNGGMGWGTEHSSGLMFWGRKRKKQTHYSSRIG